MDSHFSKAIRHLSPTKGGNVRILDEIGQVQGQGYPGSKKHSIAKIN